MNRFRIAFNTQNKKHMKAYEILSKQIPNKKSDFIAQCIIAYDNKEELKEIVKSAVIKAISEVGLMQTPHTPKMNFEKTLTLKELPEELTNIEW